MNKPKFFKNVERNGTGFFYCFFNDENIKVCTLKSYIEISKTTLKMRSIDDEDFTECTEAEFLRAYHFANSELNLQFRNLFAKENKFIENEQLKSYGY